jgi:hypothetical protein
MHSKWQPNGGLSCRQKLRPRRQLGKRPIAGQMRRLSSRKRRKRSGLSRERKHSRQRSKPNGWPTRNS